MMVFIHRLDDGLKHLGMVQGAMVAVRRHHLLQNDLGGTYRQIVMSRLPDGTSRCALAGAFWAWHQWKRMS
jgi:hypothetical protein